MVVEILELSYLENRNKVFILQCCWFGPINEVIVDERYALVNIKYKVMCHSNEPFVLVEQTHHVYYTLFCKLDWTEAVGPIS